MITLSLLGGASLESPAGPLAGRVSQRARIALLALLAVARDKPVSRDKLIAYLWPESDDERARHRLSESLYVIRKTLGDATRARKVTGERPTQPSRRAGRAPPAGCVPGPCR